MVEKSGEREKKRLEEEVAEEKRGNRGWRANRAI